MDNFLISLGVVLTMAVPLTVGIVLRLGKVLDQRFSSTANKVVYFVCLPVSLACSVYKSDFSGENFPVGAAVFSIAFLAVGCILLMLILPRIVKDRPKAASMIQGILRANASIYGIPVATALYGGENIGVFCILIAISIICFNVMSILIFSTLLSKKSNPLQVIASVLKNPNIWGILIGLALNLLRWKIPAMVYDPINAMGKMVTPLSFIGIGASFSLASLRGNGKYLGAVSVGKLVLLPMAAVALGALLGFRGEVMLSIFVVFGMPCAVASYAMAERMGGDGPLAAQCVMSTSLFSIGTVFLWVLVLKNLCLI